MQGTCSVAELVAEWIMSRDHDIERVSKYYVVMKMSLTYGYLSSVSIELLWLVYLFG